MLRDLLFFNFDLWIWVLFVCCVCGVVMLLAFSAVERVGFGFILGVGVLPCGVAWVGVLCGFLGVLRSFWGFVCYGLCCTGLLVCLFCFVSLVVVVCSGFGG